MEDSIETIIIDNLMLDINSGKYKANEKLPSENELVDNYGVPRIIVRKAYERLEQMGYIYSKQGKGRYIKGRRQQIELFLSGKESFSKKMLDKGYNFKSKNIYCRRIEYNQKIYNELCVSESDEVYEIGRLRIIDNKPMALHVSYVAKSLFNDIGESGKYIESMFEYYRSKGYSTFNTDRSIISISFPTIVEREILECSNLVPLLILECNSIDDSTGRILQHTKIFYRTDCFKYIVSYA